MILTLAAAIIFSALIVWFVLLPLFSAENMDVFSSSYKGFADEAELRQVLVLRDQLIDRLCHGTSAEPRVAELSEGDSFDALTSLCLRLQRADLPFLPQASAVEQKPSAKPEQNGFARTGFLLLTLVCSVIIFMIARVPVAFGQPLAPQNSQSGQTQQPNSASNQQAVESLHILEPGALLPTSNRYIVTPAQARVLVHHVSGFSVPLTHSNSTKIVMAVPENVFDWQIVEIKPEALAKQITVTQWNGMPAVQLPEGTQGLAVSLTSQFMLNGQSGRVVWKNDKLPAFPGDQVAVLFEVPGVLKQIFGSMADDWNVWPPRLVRPGQGVQLSSRQIQMNPQNPPRRVQIVSREAVEGGPFIKFEVVGLVPSRTPLIVLGALVGAILFGVALIVSSRRARWRIDAPESLLR